MKRSSSSSQEKKIQNEASSLKNSFIFSILTVLSRFLGLIRDQIKSYIFGTSIFIVAFDIAYQLPNIFRSLLAEGAITQILIPTYSRIKKNNTKEKALEEVSVLVNWVLLFLITFSIIIILFLPQIIGFLTHDSSLSTEKGILTLKLSYILFPVLIFFSIAAIFMALQYNHGIYWTSSFGPALLNIFIIALFSIYLFFFYHKSNFKEKIITFSYIILISTFLQMGFQIFIAYRFKIRIKFNFKITDNKQFKNFSTAFIATIFTTLSYQISFVIDIYLANYIKEVPGAISALSYSQRLIQLPVGIIGVSFMTGLLPLLSQKYIDKLHTDFFHTLFIGIRFILFLSLPASLGLFLYATPIIRLIFEKGAFDANSTFITSIALQYYAIGIIFYSFKKILVSALLVKNTKKILVSIALIQVFINIVLSVLLLPYLQHGGLALSSSLSSMLASFLFFKYIFQGENIFKKYKVHIIKIGKIIFINILLLMILLAINQLYIIEKVYDTIIIIAFSVFIYYGLSKLFRIEEVQLKRILK